MKWYIFGAGVGLGALLFILAAISAERDFTDMSHMVQRSLDTDRYT